MYICQSQSPSSSHPPLPPNICFFTLRIIRVPAFVTSSHLNFLFAYFKKTTKEWHVLIWLISAHRLSRFQCSRPGRLAWHQRSPFSSGLSSAPHPSWGLRGVCKCSCWWKPRLQKYRRLPPALKFYKNAEETGERRDTLSEMLTSLKNFVIKKFFFLM